MAEDWVAAGQALPDLWHHTLREVAIVFRGVNRRIADAQKLQRARDYGAAQLQLIAVHCPSEFPSADDYLGGTGKPKRKGLTEEAQASLAEANAMAYRLLAKRKTADVS